MCVTFNSIVSIHSSELFEVASADFVVAIVATHRVLKRPLERPWLILNSFTPF
jgi:hypothetical protein